MARPRNIDRDQVLNAAEAIVLERGAAELTIDAVAQAVGITKGGVQYCFGTKAGLIDAMVERWCREFQAEIDFLTTPTDDPIAAIGGYIEATAQINKLTHARAAGMMAVLLQSPEHMATVRTWYREHLQPLDLSTPEGKKARIAFMAMEGAFLLRSFGFMQMDDAEWTELFGEIKATLPTVELPAAEAPLAQAAADGGSVQLPSSHAPATADKSPQTTKAPATAGKSPQTTKAPNDAGKSPQSTKAPSTAGKSPQPAEADNDADESPRGTEASNAPLRDDDTLPFFPF